MKSDVIAINNQGEGFEKAKEETRKVADYKGLNDKQSLHLLLFTEEMLSMIRIISTDINASFWIEAEGNTVDLHLTTNLILDAKKRAQLINAATTRKNEAAKSLIGRIRDSFEQAMASEATFSQPPYEIYPDIVGRNIDDPEWDEYECSVLRKLADNVKVSIVGSTVDMTVSKTFA